MCEIVSHFAKATSIFSAYIMLCSNKEGLDALMINIYLSICYIFYHIPLVVLNTKIDCNAISILSQLEFCMQCRLQ